MTRPAPVRAVVFDLFITLTDFDAERSRPAFEAELAAVLGADPTAFRTLFRSTFTERATGAFGDPRATFGTLAERLGLDPTPEQIETLCRMRHRQQRRAAMPRAGVLDVIRQVRAGGYATGILTDCTSEIVELWPSLPYREVVDAVTFSCQVGRRKPHPAGYLDVVGQLGVAAGECVYVGDGGSGELTGAAGVGMTAVLLETPLGADSRYDPETGWSGRSISHLAQLPALLEELQAAGR